MSRILARGRPAADPGCAGCAQLGIVRALRRAGLDAQGGPGCDPAADRAPEPSSGRWAAVTGLRRLSIGAQAVLDDAFAAGARLLVVADGMPGEAPRVAALLAEAGARVVRVDPADLRATEAAARAASAGPRSALVALAPCRRGEPPGAPFSIAPSRCNRCGACLGLGCAAISDPGGEAMAIDAAVCTGCGLCAPLCRGRAIER